MLDGAAVGAIPNGLLLDPANDAGAALLRFFVAAPDRCPRRAGSGALQPVLLRDANEDEAALEWAKEETRLTFAFLWDEMLEARPWAGVRWHESGLALDDLFVAPT